MDRLVLWLMCLSGWVSWASAQFGKGNANKFVDQMLADLSATQNDSLLLEDEKFILIVDLLVFSPELHLELRDGELQGLKSLARSSDAIVTYNESAGAPVFTISSSLLLSNLSMASKAQGKIVSLGFGLTMPNIKQKVSIEGVDISLIIDLNIGDISNLKLNIRELEISDLGHIEVKIIGLTPELDSLVSPISTLIINTVKRDLKTLVTPLIKQTMDDVLQKNAPKDLSAIFA